ncbi:MAG: error-prone DNA polymerase [Betaproteobacteria bacterium]|nr:error-prone DNA polymerase [Betaproteobacteria bacterium]
MVSLPAYAELHCVTNFTFLRGASHPEELVARAAQLGYCALAVTDECSLAGVVRAHVAAREHGLKLVIGAEFRIADGPRVVLLATDRAAYGNLSQLITTARRRSGKGSYSVRWDDMDRGTPGCLAILIPPDIPASNPPSPFPHPRPSPERRRGARASSLPSGERLGARDGGAGVRGKCGEAKDPWNEVVEDARRLARAYDGRAWIAAELLCGPDDRARLGALRALGAAAGLPLAAAGDVHMHVRSRRALQDTLTAIRLRTTVAEARGALYPNAERHLRMRVRLAQLYPPELLAETVRISERCTFSLDSLRYEYPEELAPAGHTPASYLREITEAGLRRRFPAGVPGNVRELIEHELALIAELEYEPYFLTVHDIVRFAHGRGILCQGRGSAANSAVCYALGITEVDPARMNMLFERFISRERNEPPDIDVDFEHQRREEVIQYLYNKYGRDRAALAATVITYRTRSAIRDAGKALGFDLQQVDRLSRSFAWWDGKHSVSQRLAEAGFSADSPQVERLVELVGTLAGFPRHLSQHTGGFVFARGLLSRLVPIENAAMPARSVIQWDKDDLDALGLLKVDVLALGMLSAIRRALDMIGAWRGTTFTMSDVPPEDPAVYEMIQHADTIGVFQIESRAQMSMLPRLKPASYYDLVIEVAIVRPGPIQGGMVHPYLRRRQGIEPVTCPSEAVKSVLARTLGVPIFQEQVMQLAIVAAGFTPGESDKLRRSMAAWRRKGGLEHFEQRLVSGMLARGYRREFAEQIYRQILGFGEYGFPEAHSASFALLVYVSAWIKRHEPAAFLAALLNSQPMGFYAPSQLVQDARRHDVAVLPVDVTVSDWDCVLEKSAESNRQDAKEDTSPDTKELESRLTTHESRFSDRVESPITNHQSRLLPQVRLGLRMISGFAEAAAARLIAARRERPFDSVEDMARRSQLNRRDLKLLAAAGALKPLAAHRRLAHWEAAGIERATPVLGDCPIDEPLPQLAPPGEADELIADYASLGLTLGRHPLALLRPRLARMRLATAAALRELPHGRPARAAGIVVGRQRPDTASGVIFVTLEDETGSVNVIVWRDLAERQRRELLGSRLMGVYGTLEREGEVVHLIAKQLVNHSELLGALETSSRDFH